MEKIKISLSISDNNDITVLNNKTGESFIVKHVDKVLNAEDVYDVFSFCRGCQYSVESDINTVEDKNIATYYAEIVNLFQEISSELNDIVVDDNAV